jgi:hypothetical protein
VITLDKLYPMVEPKQGVEAMAFNKAVKRVQDEYKQAIEANKIELATLQLELELYNKKARVQEIELQVFNKPTIIDTYA